MEIRSSETSEMKIWVLPTGKASTRQRQWLRMRQSGMGSRWWVSVVVPSVWAPTAYSQGCNLSINLLIHIPQEKRSNRILEELFPEFIWIWVVQMVDHSGSCDVPLCLLEDWRTYSSSYSGHHWLTVLRNYYRLESSALHKVPMLPSPGQLRSNNWSMYNIKAQIPHLISGH